MTRRQSVVRGSFLGTETIALVVNTPVLIGAEEYIPLPYNAGEINELIDFRLFVDAPPLATLGTHNIGLLHVGSPKYVEGVRAFNQNLQFCHGYWFQTPTVRVPATVDIQANIQTKLWYGLARVIQAYYWNQTDVIQSNARTYELHVNRYKV